MTSIIEKAISGKFHHYTEYELHRNEEGNVYAVHLYGLNEHKMREGGTFKIKELFMMPEFWQSLGKACGWNNGYDYMGTMIEQEWVEKALYFHELNLTTSFEEAVAWLGKVVEG